MLRPPRLHSGRRRRTLEVRSVGTLGEPPGLRLAPAFLPASRLGAIALVTQITPIRQEDAFAVQTVPRVGQR